MRNVLLALSVVAALLFAPGFQTAVQAQPVPCGVAFALECDGECPPLDACVDIGGFCACQPAAPPCGLLAGPPLCWGECPPILPVCAHIGGICECVVPTLSEWGIIAMSLVMFGGVIYLRRRAEWV